MELRREDISRIDKIVAELGSEPFTAANMTALLEYARLVAQWDSHHNLTGARSVEELFDILFADAVVLADPIFVPASSKVIDVGAGGGAPALPLTLLRPDTRVVLLEPRQKRAAFLRWAIGSLGLERRAEVRAQRLQQGVPDAPFDVALSRATFEPSEWQEMGLKLARVCIVLAVSHPTLPKVVADRIVAEREYCWPFSGAPRVARAVTG